MKHHLTEKVEAECRVDEEKDAHEAHDVGDLGQDVHDGVDEESDGDRRLDQSEDPHDAEAADDLRGAAHGVAKTGEFDEQAEVSPEHDEAVEDVPALSEVVTPLGQ